LQAGGHRTFAVAAAVAVALIAPAGAQAATVGYANGKITIAAGPGESNKMSVNEGDGSYQITESGGSIEAGPGCTKAPDAQRVGCPATGTVVLEAALGDGDDSLIVSAGLPAEIDGGPGNDSITGGFGDDVIRGGDGADRIDGNTGNDTVISAGGDDSLSGGAGDDSLQSGDGDDTLNGDDGNDTLTAGDGDDKLCGGAGNDRLEAGKGADELDGGPGDDVLLTAEGEFTGTRERGIRCGAGRDTLTAGPSDAFAGDCERTDGASLRLAKGGRIPLRLYCPSACKGTVRISDARNRINARARLAIAAGRTGTVRVRLAPAEIARLFRQKKVRLTARFALGGGQTVRGTFTLLRRV
jgi:Ca2+-binding RTX toxin-like protein